MNGYTSNRVLELVEGVTYRQLHYWQASGLIQPSIQKAAGTGHVVKYSLRDVQYVMVHVQLQRTGIGHETSRRFIESLKLFSRTWPNEQLHTETLWIEADSIYLRRPQSGAVHIQVDLEPSKAALQVACNG